MAIVVCKGDISTLKLCVLEDFLVVKILLLICDFCRAQEGREGEFDGTIKVEADEFGTRELAYSVWIVVSAVIELVNLWRRRGDGPQLLLRQGGCFVLFLLRLCATYSAEYGFDC